MPIINVLLGIVLLFFGRALYWVFVAVVGFLVGFELAAQLLADQEQWVRVLVALAGGALGAIVGMLAVRAVFAIGGLFAGGYLGLMLARAAGVPGEPLVWFAIVGILGAILAAMAMDWAIIVLSSLAGAAAIVGAFRMDPTIAAVLYVGLVVAGIFVQGRRLRPAPAAAHRPKIN